MRMKKYGSLLSALFLALCLALCLFGCYGEDGTDKETQTTEELQTEHTHRFSAWKITKESTCTVAGTQTRVCEECGYEEQTSIPSGGHLEVIDPALMPTCLTDGKTLGSHCDVCDAVLTASTVLPATGHSAVTIPALSPTCTAEGRTEGKRCGVCNTVLEGGEVLPQTGHTPVTDAAVAPTCKSEGKTEGSHCAVCNATLVAQATVPVSGHQYGTGTVITPATCDAEGRVKYTCTAPGCGHSYTESYALSPLDGTELYERAVEYVGEIWVYDKNGDAKGLATGFVYQSNGVIVTNYHVIDGAYSAEITIGEETYAIESVLAYDENIDLAVLKINATGLVAATVCKKPVKTGEVVYAIGSPRGMTNTYSKGVVTFADRNVDGVVHVQHDASITHGNSGGPLINAYGEVIGINTWGLADSQNLNFAVFTGELDNLVFGAPISLSAFYEQNLTSYDVLLEWVLENANASVSDEVRFDHQGESAWYSLAYSVTGDTLYLFVEWEFEDGAILDLLIDLSCDPSEYLYYATYALSGKQNQTSGVIDASAFTDGTPLSYTSYKGAYWDQTELIELYRRVAVNLVDWLDWATAYYEMGVTLEDMGFEVFQVNTSA